MKEAVFPFVRFPGADVLLGPEMRSTGEVMGIARTSRLRSPRHRPPPAPGLPPQRNVFLTVADRDKPPAMEIAT